MDKNWICKTSNMDCMNYMKDMADLCVDFTLTDIPYNAVNRESNGLRNLDKGAADECTFEMVEFLDGVYRVTKNSICIFCGKEQFSTIYAYFAGKKGTVRPIVWEKSNPSPIAYKTMDEILRNIGDTVYIEKIVKTVYNFKARE